MGKAPMIMPAKLINPTSNSDDVFDTSLLAIERLTAGNNCHFWQN